MDAKPGATDAGKVDGLTVMANSVTPYLRVVFTLGRRHLVVARQATFLGVIPLRWIRSEVPLDSITAVHLVPVFYPTRLLVAALAGTSMVVFGLSIWVRSLLAVVAVALLLLSFVAAVRIESEAGRVTVPVCSLQRGRAAHFIARVLRHLEGGR
jgi:hypothetical protein